jgi:hypothetical protein
VAPVTDEARRRNGSLPGMGGVFNLVNLHVYHYAGNNPVKYIDPDGRLLVISGDEENANLALEKINSISRDQYKIEKVKDGVYVASKTNEKNRDGSREYSKELNSVVNDKSNIIVIGLLNDSNFGDIELDMPLDVFNQVVHSQENPILNGITMSGQTSDENITLSVVSDRGENISFSFFDKNTSSIGIMHKLVSSVIPNTFGKKESPFRTENKIRRQLGL